MNQNLSDEEYQEEWEEFFREAVEEVTVNTVEDIYQDVLRKNLDKNAHLSNLPEEGRAALADMAATVYGEQAQRILDSSYVDQQEVGLAVATAFLDQKKQLKVGAQAQGLVDFYWDDMSTHDQRYGKDNYQQWAFEALTNPWPPHQLEEGWASVNRFKPGEDDPAYQ